MKPASAWPGKSGSSDAGWKFMPWDKPVQYLSQIYVWGNWIINVFKIPLSTPMTTLILSHEARHCALLRAGRRFHGVLYCADIERKERECILLNNLMRSMYFLHEIPERVGGVNEACERETSSPGLYLSIESGSSDGWKYMLWGKTLHFLSQILRIGKLDNKFMCHKTQAHFITILNKTHFVSWAWGGPTRRTLVGIKTFPWRVKSLHRQVGKSGKTSSFLQTNSSARQT